MTLRKTAKWFVVLVVLLGLTGGGYGWWWWARTDALLRDELLKKRAELAPDWDVEIGRAHFDWNRRIHIYDVTIKARGQAAAVLILPEVVLTVDREKLSASQQIVVQKVQILNPVADLTRSPDGVWNWHALLTLKPTNKPLPEWEIEQGTIRVLLERADGEPPGEATLRNVDVRLIPSAKRQFLVEGAALVDKVGKLALDGEWNVDAKTWRIDGRMQEVTSGSEMLSMAAISSPEFQAKLARADEMLRQASGEASPPSGGERLAMAERDDRLPSLSAPTAEVPVPPSGVPDFGVDGAFDLDFRIEKPPAAGPQFKFLVTARQGQVGNAALPFPLRDVQGQIYWDNDRIRIRNITASNGTTRVWVDGEFRRSGDGVPGQIGLSVTDLNFDERFRDRLPPSSRRVYDMLSLTGRADVSLTLEHDGKGGWTSKDFRLIAKDCGLTHERFAYPVRNLSGSVDQQDPDTYVASLEGRLGNRPIAIRGFVRDPGPAVEASFAITVDQLPIDERFVEACPRPARKVLEALDLQGTVSGTVSIRRSAGQFQPLETTIRGRIDNGSLEYVAFPYRFTDLSGNIEYNSAAGTWSFTDVQGFHGTSRVAAGGAWIPTASPALTLRVQAEGVLLDKHLELALPEALRDVWSDLSPSGKSDAVIDLAWAPGEPVSVEIPRAQIYDGALLLRAFPYRLENVAAEFSYQDDFLQLHSFSGWHDRTRIQAPRAASPQGAGFVVCPPQGEWRIRIHDFAADDLDPGREFREALQPELRSVIESLDPRGSMSLSGALEFRGASHAPGTVTAAWDLEAVLTEATLAVPGATDLEGIYGNVTARGTWDGAQANSEGEIDLRTLRVKGHQLAEVRGPWQLNDRQLTIGSGEALLQPGERAQPVPLEERITAQAFGEGCLLTLDAAALLGDEVSWHLLATMTNGRLEEYARQHMPDAKNLAGVMTGWIDVFGRGASANHITGNGRLQISPAALYELPVILQLFQVLYLAPPERAAFNHAFVDFAVEQGAFHFKLIDLVGEAIAFRGKGTATFGGDVALDFYSRMPRNRIPVPLVNRVIDPLLSEVTTGWVGIKVTGRASAPRAELTPAPVLDEALTRFLSAFEPPADMRPSRFAVPNLLPTLPPSPTRRQSTMEQ